MTNNKEVLVTIRISPVVRDDFKKAAELRGSTMSGLMHQFIVQTIREEKRLAPHAFVASDPPRLAPVLANIVPGRSAARDYGATEITRTLSEPLPPPLPKKRKRG